MNIMIFDTETTSIDKPFCYNIGYGIFDTIEMEFILKRDYVIEQVWHNPMLFSTAYYADKRDGYVKAMRGRTTKMRKFGTVCQQMINDIAKYEVVGAYAYNSPFDDRVFSFNCDWFRCINPFDTLPIYDIRGYAIKYIVDNDYKKFCDEHNLYTESGNYSTTAENVYRYITNDVDFIESHTALDDSEIETEILINAILRGAEYGTDYKVPRSIKRVNEKTFTVKKNNEIVFEDNCMNYTISKSRNTVYLK